MKLFVFKIFIILTFFASMILGAPQNRDDEDDGDSSVSYEYSRNLNGNDDVDRFAKSKN